MTSATLTARARPAIVQRSAADGQPIADASAALLDVAAPERRPGLLVPRAVLPDVAAPTSGLRVLRSLDAAPGAAPGVARRAVATPTLLTRPCNRGAAKRR